MEVAKFVPSGQRIPFFLALVGLPGSGKSTLGKQLAKEFFLPYISAGDLLRNIEGALPNNGGFAEDSTITATIDSRLNEQTAFSGAIIDGYPRNVVQEKAMASYAKDCNGTIVYLSLEVDEPAILRRIESREDNRKDDMSESAVENRIMIFITQTRPLLDTTNSMVLKINADGSVNTTRDRAVWLVGDILNRHVLARVNLMKRSEILIRGEL